jgi:hypothetical protein
MDRFTPLGCNYLHQVLKRIGHSVFLKIEHSLIAFRALVHPNPFSSWPKSRLSNWMYYILTLIFGFVGVLAALRTMERLVHGAPTMATQLFVAVIGLSVAVLCLKKARAASHKKS